MSEKLKAYQFISQNVPSWLDILKSLEKKITAREDHVSRVPVPAHPLKKSGSIGSLRLDSAKKNEGVGMEVMSAPQDGDMANPISGPNFLSNDRKRKTTSIGSDESIPSRYQTRSMIIVFYDSEIQKSFEDVVKHIAIAMNNLRKVKSSSRIQALSRGSTISDFLGKARSGDSQPDTLSSTGSALEKAQNLCERGAHQFLRAGDCEAELVGARDSLEEAKRLAEQEVLRLEVEEPQIDEKSINHIKKVEIGENLDNYLSNHNNNLLEIDENPSDGEDDEDPLMALARLQPPRRAGQSITVPA